MNLKERLSKMNDKGLFPGAEITNIVHMGKIKKAIAISFSVILPREISVLGKEFETVMGVGDGYLYFLPRKET